MQNVKEYQAFPQEVDRVLGSEFHRSVDAVIGNVKAVQMEVDFGQAEIGLVQFVVWMVRD